jgi:hypothetical protein
MQCFKYCEISWSILEAGTACFYHNTPLIYEKKICLCNLFTQKLVQIILFLFFAIEKLILLWGSYALRYDFFLENI